MGMTSLKEGAASLLGRLSRPCRPRPVLAVVPAAYFVTALLAMWLSTGTGYVVTLWPPAAILLASLIRCRKCDWAALLLSCFLAECSVHFLVSGKIAAASVAAAANTFEGFLIASLIRRFANQDRWYLSGRWMAVFVASSLLGAATVAAVGAPLITALDTGAFSISWFNWVSADSLSFLIVTPFLLCWTEPALRPGLRPRDLAEPVALTLLLSAATFAALTNPLPLQFMIFPVLALMTVRTGLTGATTGTIAVAIIGLVLTFAGMGPFRATPGLDTGGNVIFLQLYILAAALCAIPLAVIFMVRQSLAEEVERQGAIGNAALSNMAQGLCMFDAEQRLITCNQRYADLFDLPPELTLPGTPLQAVVQRWVSAGGGADLVQRLLERRADEAEGENPYREIKLPNGRIINVHRRPLAGGGWVATHEDVTEQRHATQKIAHLANHDPLTDLPNRALFRSQLQTLVARAKRGQGFALLSLDLDRFKQVNDSLGHGVGDELLKQVAGRLRTIVRDGDVVTRLGGDEFAILQAPAKTPEEASMLALRVVEKLGEPYLIDSNEIDIAVSVGIAMSPSDGAEPADLLRKSDLALYCAKSEGRGTYRFYKAGMDEVTQEKRILETQLKAAIQKSEFELYYQPIMDLRTGLISSFEALIRWRHPTRGLVMPDQFIPAAEEMGLINQIGEWVVRQACREIARWPEQVKVAVNLSPVQFKSGNLVALVTSAAAAAGISPERLDVELTESVLLQGTESVLDTLKQLRALNVGIALDDFGTGYSSLGYLRTFLFDKIKIDRSFISELGKADSLAIVHATIDLSTKLHMTTTAEGVETAEQTEILKAQGCTHIQGYYVGHPMSARDARKKIGAVRVRARAAPLTQAA